jgi:hypothetical protein
MTLRLHAVDNLQSINMKKRIPYEAWTRSQLSVAAHYGGCVINGERYELDYDNARTEGEGDNKRYFPDLVAVDNSPRR